MVILEGERELNVVPALHLELDREHRRVGHEQRHPEHGAALDNYGVARPREGLVEVELHKLLGGAVLVILGVGHAGASQLACCDTWRAPAKKNLIVHHNLSLKSLCGGGVPSSHPALAVPVFFLSVRASPGPVLCEKDFLFHLFGHELCENRASRAVQQARIQAVHLVGTELK